jgi:hypothetical protein
MNNVCRAKTADVLSCDDFSVLPVIQQAAIPCVASRHGWILGWELLAAGAKSNRRGLQRKKDGKGRFSMVDEFEKGKPNLVRVVLICPLRPPMLVISSVYGLPKTPVTFFNK